MQFFSFLKTLLLLLVITSIWCQTKNNLPMYGQSLFTCLSVIFGGAVESQLTVPRSAVSERPEPVQYANSNCNRVQPLPFVIITVCGQGATLNVVSRIHKCSHRYVGLSIYGAIYVQGYLYVGLSICGAIYIWGYRYVGLSICWDYRHVRLSIYGAIDMLGLSISKAIEMWGYLYVGLSILELSICWDYR